MVNSSRQCMEDVRELVIRAKTGDRQAFADLYDQFAPLVRSVGFDATGCVQASEDVCQEVFLHAYRKLGQLRDAARFAGWLMTIARRSCADWRHMRRSRPKLGLEGVEPAANPPEPIDEESQRLLDAIRQLPAKERTALHLFYLAEQPAQAAREAMGLSNSGFYKVLDRAKKRLASILQERKVIP
jgi:RNA polymerase sigma-70 factor (ECF subfamily)